MASVPLVRVVRSGVEESVHAVDVAVVDAEGLIVAHAGDPGRAMFARSSMKPLQATVSLSLAPFDFSSEEIAVMCASHNAEPVHVAAVRSLLARAGVEETALRCPPMRPWDEEASASSPERRPINSDCSGKHGGMLAACLGQGWDLETYRDPDHPLQQAVLAAVLSVTGLQTVRVGVDGCGVPVHGMPLHGMARIYAAFSAPRVWDGLGDHAERAVGAMRAQPYLVAGRNRVDTAVMETLPGVVAKGGAEGLICAGLLQRGLGIAVKVRDGGHRAAGPALLRVLTALDAVDGPSAGKLAGFLRPPVLGGGRPVGEIVTEFDLIGPEAD
jgi:L-asparaginase II